MPAPCSSMSRSSRSNPRRSHRLHAISSIWSLPSRSPSVIELQGLIALPIGRRSPPQRRASVRRTRANRASPRCRRSCRSPSPYLEPLPLGAERLGRGRLIGKQFSPLYGRKGLQGLNARSQLIYRVERFLLDPRLFPWPRGRSRRFNARIVSVEGIRDPLQVRARLVIEQRHILPLPTQERAALN